ncbi:litaf zinc finger [Fusarium beomiforme]|uniref:Litaf zinc finger n=1 Tax=Fusarium beomiforme TaxID=44412 RepID=A0A9P5DYR8_9HYPO|nr:litaf zinc finger [Fusarium beomiforme]
MDKSAPTPEHQYNAHPQQTSEHELPADNEQPPNYESRDFSSPLAQPPLTNPPPTHQLQQDPNVYPPPQPQQQQLQSLPLQALQSQSAPVLCPSCGVRAMTVTTEESGGFTQ